MVRKTAKTEILEEQKKRAVSLKAQGWATSDVAKDTDILASTINANWRTWARQYGIDLPAASPGRPQPAGTSNLVTSYKVDPATGEQLTEPVTEAVDLDTKSMPNDFAAQGGSFRETAEREFQLHQAKKARKKAAEPASAQTPPDELTPKKAARFALVTELQEYDPLGLLESINRLVWEQIRAGSLSPFEWSSSADIADGSLTMTFTLPIKRERGR